MPEIENPTPNPMSDMRGCGINLPLERERFLEEARNRCAKITWLNDPDSIESLVASAFAKGFEAEWRKACSVTTNQLYSRQMGITK